MDVEGAEFRILPTIGKSLNKINFPTLYISFHYHFLNEHIYYQKMPSVFLNKLLIKLENRFGFSLFKKTIHKKMANLFEDLKVYDYIYKTDGTLVSFETLKDNPELIKNTDLVFTNKPWTST